MNSEKEEDTTVPIHEEPMPMDGPKKMSILKRVSNGFISLLETAFYK